MRDAAQKAQVIRIETDRSSKFSAFSDKVLADEETFILMTQEADLAGLPESFVASLQAAAKAKGQSGWAAVDTRSAVQPFLENATRRDPDVKYIMKKRGFPSGE
ncbi:MAG: hypothetical protein ACK519_01110 [Sphingomonadaceae bacterium]|jgi:peptidyl-dipeptidase Dcp